MSRLFFVRNIYKAADFVFVEIFIVYDDFKRFIAEFNLFCRIVRTKLFSFYTKGTDTNGTVRRLNNCFGRNALCRISTCKGILKVFCRASLLAGVLEW